MTTARASWAAVGRAVLEDLRPASGRLSLSWRVAALCTLMVMLSMTYGIPESAVSCFVIFFVMKPDSGESSVLALALVVLVSLVVALMLPLIQATITYPALQLLSIAICSFVLLFLGAASKLGPLGGIIALVIAFVMTMLGYIPFGEIATRALLYAWLMASAPMGLVLLFNMFFGLYPHKVLRRELAERLRLAAQGLDGRLEAAALWPSLAAGIAAQQTRLGWIRLFHLLPNDEQTRMGQAILNTYRALLAVAALQPDELSASQRQALSALCEQLAQDLEQGKPVRPVALDAPADSGDGFQAKTELQQALAALAGGPDIGHSQAPSEPFFAPDAWTNPNYQYHAIKATAAAILCYLIYSAMDWQGIHTAMITCYVAALGSTGETVHKLALRIAGCLLGAALGFLTILYVMPHMVSVGSLAVVVFLVSLLGAWVFTGPERISYAGIQIAFAFYLVVLQGFGPSLDLDSARDRIVGVLLGNTVMYLTFTLIWPVSIVGALRKHLDSAAQGLSVLPALWKQEKAQAVQQSAGIAQALSAAEYELELMLLEPSHLRPEDAETLALKQQWQDLRRQFGHTHTQG